MTMVAGKRYCGNGDDLSMDKEEAGHFRQIMKEVFAHSRAANPADYKGGFTRSD
ncbi:cytochrome P450 81E8 [Prunus yedoensis var. nudiflora]|uniref:Cytochrome P450 81E8 n=1 Tax=Prunus yedoensis var. nudiflora TaxID=2094558 RepID=A0A314Z7G1_PRUYE|nr:cytochrome P450 81E8 [Prunus yedoensis var. nudiflora]